MPRSTASDLGLHCLPITPLGVSRLQWVNNSKQIYCNLLCKRLNDKIVNSVCCRAIGCHIASQNDYK